VAVAAGLVGRERPTTEPPAVGLLVVAASRLSERDILEAGWKLGPGLGAAGEGYRSRVPPLQGVLYNPARAMLAARARWSPED
jgi:hypothetical protein